MKRNTAFVVLAATLVVCLQVTPSFGSGIISAKDLAKISGDDNVTIVSTRKAEDYEKIHIEGAVHLYHKELYQEGDLKGLIKTPEEIAVIFGSKGITDSTTVVVYDDGKGKAAGRLYWILEYEGCKDVKVLDGSMKAWRKARKKVTKKATEITPVTFTASPNPDVLATIEDVKTEGVLLLDARSKEEFDGEKGEVERKGHIPGAVHFEFKNVLNEDGTLKSNEELAEIATAAGITADKDIIVYCETSVRAGIVYLVLDAILEYPNVKVYDGALYEWAANPDNPLE